MKFLMTIGLVLGFGSCLGEASEPAPPSEKTTAPTEAKPPKAEPDAAGASWDEGLRATLARSVVQPEADDGTYTVDPFVAALVFEQLSRTGGAPWLESHEGDGAGGAPKAGYRVQKLEKESLPTALGLREGDIIEALNGVVLSSPERIGFALDGAENRVTVMVFREDYSFTMSYRMSEGVAWRSVLTGFTGQEDPSAGVVADADPPDAPATPNANSKAEKPVKVASGSSPGRPRTSSPKSVGSSPQRPPRGSAASNTIRCPSSTRCTIAKATYQDLVASPKKLQSQVKVVPAIRNNVHSGYKLSSIKAGSPASKLGFRAGDKITHVNGRDLTDDMQALQLYWSLGSTRLFKVRYQRGSKKLVKTIAVE